MKNIIKILGLLLLSSVAIAPQNNLTPDDFGENASVHVKKLCEFGTRATESIAAKRTVDYLLDEFSSQGLNVLVDTFYFCDFKIQNRSILVNNRQILIKTAFINYSITDTFQIDGYWTRINNSTDKNEVKHKIVFTSTSRDIINLKEYEPKAILVIDTNQVKSIDFKETEKIKICFEGNLTSDWKQSFNIITTYNHKFPNDSTIIITAHWDSSNGVGAGDNASGTATLLELTKFLKTKLSDLKYNLVFIATGAEEDGLYGSTSYIFNNTNEINKCILNLNIDDVADSLPYIETTNYGLNSQFIDTSSIVTLLSNSKNYSKFLMTSFMEIYGNRFTDNNKISRLRSNFKMTMNELGYKYIDAGCCSGVDSRTFNYVGIPYIHVSSIPIKGQDNANTPEDIYDESFIDNINLNAKIISKILLDYNK